MRTVRNACQIRVAEAQSDLILDTFIKYPPIGGPGDWEMATDKSAAVFRRVHADLKETMPPLIERLVASGVSSKSLQQINEKSLKDLWKRWIKRYRDLKKEYQVTSSMRKGQTGLSGDDALQKSANDAITGATESWTLFAWFHAAWGQHARFDDGLVKTSLTPEKAAPPASDPTIGSGAAAAASIGVSAVPGAHDLTVVVAGGAAPPTIAGAAGAAAGGSGTSGAAAGGVGTAGVATGAVSGAGAVADALGSGGAPVGADSGAGAEAGALGSAGGPAGGEGSAAGSSSRVQPHAHADVRTKRKSAVAAATAMALHVSSSSDGAEAAPEGGPEEESSWDSTLEGGEWIDHTAPGYELWAIRHERHMKRKAAREGAKGAVVTKGRRRGESVGPVKRVSVRDRRLAESVESARAGNAKEIGELKAEQFSTTMHAVTMQKVAAVKKQTAAMIEMQRAKDEAAAARARKKIDSDKLVRLVDMYRADYPNMSPSKVIEKAEEAMAKAAARRAAT